jgi:hypothetical protein
VPISSSDNEFTAFVDHTVVDKLPPPKLVRG